jgi:hypothetical protein
MDYGLDIPMGDVGQEEQVDDLYPPPPPVHDNYPNMGENVERQADPVHLTDPQTWGPRVAHPPASINEEATRSRSTRSERPGKVADQQVAPRIAGTFSLRLSDRET